MSVKKVGLFSSVVASVALIGSIHKVAANDEPLPAELFVGRVITGGAEQAVPLIVKPTKKIGVDSEGFRLSLEVGKTTFKHGEPINALTSFESLTRTVSNMVVARGFEYGLEILDKNGEPVSLSDEGQKLKSARRTFPRFDSGVMIPSMLDQGSVGSINVNFNMSQAGEYQLRVSREVPSISDPKKKVTIYSNTIKIRIEEPSENVADDIVVAGAPMQEEAAADEATPDAVTEEAPVEQQ